jgi:hypothetical protein
MSDVDFHGNLFLENFLDIPFFSEMFFRRHKKMMLNYIRALKKHFVKYGNRKEEEEEM